MPIRWTSQETLQFGRFTTQSDIWSYAVVVWEVYSRGAVPYLGMSNVEAANYVVSGHRLPQPQECPSEVWNIMTKCWNADPKLRPSWDDILQILEQPIDESVPVVKKEVNGMDYGITVEDEPVKGNATNYESPLGIQEETKQ